jgi:hypothetical protein
MQTEVQLALGNAQNPQYERLRPENFTHWSHSERRHDSENIFQAKRDEKAKEQSELHDYNENIHCLHSLPNTGKLITPSKHKWGGLGM